MSKDPGQRRLAAIMVADVVGYSRLMELDEEGTLARLKSRRTSVLTPVLRAHGGRMVKVMGDGVLIEFTSAVNAVVAALELQQRMVTVNADEPDDRKILLRIGINLGDVIGDGRDIYGEGVNVASRLESLSEPGGICVSGAVFAEANGKVRFTARDLGEPELKNMSRPVRAYQLTPVLQDLTASAFAPSATDAISVAVLPFDNMSEPTDEYFADGLTEDVITALARSRHLSVIARNSTFRYKGKSVKIQEAARDLGARYVVEGSLRRYGNRVRVTAQLIEAETGMHLWANRFDRESENIFALQDDIVTAILAQLTFSLLDAAAAKRKMAPTSSLKAYDHVLRGRAAWRRGAISETLDNFLKAVETDPNYGTALACLAFFYSEEPYMQATGLAVDDAAGLARHYAERALAADDGDSFLHHEVGTAFICLGEHDRAKHHLELAISLNPHFPNSHINLGCALAYAGAHQDGLAVIERVFGLEPRLPPAMRAVPFYVHCLLGDCESAAIDLARIESPYPSLHLLYGLCLLMNNRDEEAKRSLACIDRGRRVPFDVPGFARFFIKGLKSPDDKARWQEGFKKAGYEI